MCMYLPEFWIWKSADRNFHDIFSCFRTEKNISCTIVHQIWEYSDGEDPAGKVHVPGVTHLWFKATAAEPVYGICYLLVDNVSSILYP